MTNDLKESIERLFKKEALTESENKTIQRVLSPASADAEEQHEEALRQNAERRDPKNYSKEVKELIEETASEESRYRHFDVVDRKELAKQINEAKEKGLAFKVSRSDKKGFRYSLEILTEKLDVSKFVKDPFFEDFNENDLKRIVKIVKVDKEENGEKGEVSLEDVKEFVNDLGGWGGFLLEFLAHEKSDMRPTKDICLKVCKKDAALLASVKEFADKNNYFAATPDQPEHEVAVNDDDYIMAVFDLGDPEVLPDTVKEVSKIYLAKKAEEENLGEDYLKKEAGDPEVNKDAFNHATDVQASSPSTGLGEAYNRPRISGERLAYALVEWLSMHEGDVLDDAIEYLKDHYDFTDEEIESLFFVGDALIEDVEKDLDEDISIKPGREFEIHRGKAEFNTEDEAYCFVRDNDFFGGEYRIKHFPKKGVYVVYYEDWQEVAKEESEEVEESLNEELKVYTSTLEAFIPSKETESFWNEIVEAKKVEDLETALETIYPDGISDVALDDLLKNEEDWVRDLIELPYDPDREEKKESEEEVEVEDDIDSDVEDEEDFSVDDFDEEDIEPVDELSYYDDEDLEPVYFDDEESEEVEPEYTISIDDEIYEDEDGNPYHFSSHEEAEEFIEEHELENAEITRQYGKAKYEPEEVEEESEEEVKTESLNEEAGECANCATPSGDSDSEETKEEGSEKTSETKSESLAESTDDISDDQLNSLAEGFLSSTFKPNTNISNVNGSEKVTETKELVNEALNKTDEDDEVVDIDEDSVDAMMGFESKKEDK